MSDTVDSPMHRPYASHGLFSDHYLTITLPQATRWQSLAMSDEVAATFSRITGIVASYVPSDNEAQTEEDLVKPILHALGHTFEVQPTLDTPGTPTKPDYVFYQDQVALVANKGKKLTEEILDGRAFAIGDAKHWDRPLDVSLKGASHVFSNKNPASQIEFYMRYSGVTWGILTNGRRWHLYHKDSAKRLDRYYEVDVPALLSSDDPTAFVYFYAFFSRRAFEPGALGVASILRESSDYAQGVGASLKVQAFAAVRHLAQGFLDYPRNRLTSDDATLKEIYGASLILLYRLLFILYAESRGLLPVDTNEQYRESYSLDAIKRQILGGKRLLTTSGKLWGDLRSLFDVINDGSVDMGIATYNGGLFSPATHPFLDGHMVGDHHLQLAIDALARVDGHFVDYRDLAVRHLGTIYEGLLEFHLRPIDPADGWTIEMRNDKGERHATGSYYTPDYIVTYMVDRTINPLLRRAVAPDATGKEKTDDEKIEAILALNILDMSMGSGHFLVEGTDYIARFIVDLGVTVAEDTKEPDLTYWRRRVVQSCIYGVDLNPLAVELAKLSLWLMTVAKDRPLSFLDHHLRPGNALVGSRIASLPTGTTPGGGRGRATKRREAATPDQLRLFDDDVFRHTMQGAVDSMGRIEAMLGETIAAVKEQERLYTAVHDRLTRAYGPVANLATAIGFGTIHVGDALPTLVDYVRGTMLAISARQQDQFGRWIDAVNEITERHAFFHWELEFPEVFFDRDGTVKGNDGGFDGVIGNPPYVRQEALGGIKPYLATAYRETYDGSADLYVYFYQQGLRLTRASGRMS